ncbi:hypothetical protein EDI_289940 [Entamoeba dispar SAW760]|uniref:Uncharacterized protein n=1 Tax=Entamoeba dispar (strain ATCC PRA-260 / SAW760) TaxID=370354 RepID=B0EKA0_ENTDS|nr:uncharacterized protein EDI_289940 [Entamoeba dispar SAW760]EDR25046.1 hypothetical protein EDI_289940 [Entamoeba dispar SAW760]|eukprot:EDR25046.1 hypothetical protein EDI_289940 [Entamoeba dispar SAW760]
MNEEIKRKRNQQHREETNERMNRTILFMVSLWRMNGYKCSIRKSKRISKKEYRYPKVYLEKVIYEKRNIEEEAKKYITKGIKGRFYEITIQNGKMEIMKEILEKKGYQFQLIKSKKTANKKYMFRNIEECIKEGEKIDIEKCIEMLIDEMNKINEINKKEVELGEGFMEIEEN